MPEVAKVFHKYKLLHPVGADAVTATTGQNGYSGQGGSPSNYGQGGTNGSELPTIVVEAVHAVETELVY